MRHASNDPRTHLTIPARPGPVDSPAMADPLPSSGEDEVFVRPARVLEPLAGHGREFAAVAVGGALGALARYGVGLALPHGGRTFPLATFVINVVGCFLIGALIVAVTERTQAHPLVRPFLVTGILGGFTTFSTYAVDAEQLLAAGRVGTAAAYLVGTLAAAVAATWAGIGLARAVRPGGTR
jgi:fluoride exporter